MLLDELEIKSLDKIEYQALKKLKPLATKFKIDLTVADSDINLFESLSSTYFDLYNNVDCKEDEKEETLKHLKTVYLNFIERSIIDKVNHIYSLFENPANLTLIYSSIRNLISSQAKKKFKDAKLPLIHVESENLTFHIKFLADRATDYIFDNNIPPQDNKTKFADYLLHQEESTFQYPSYKDLKDILHILANPYLRSLETSTRISTYDLSQDEQIKVVDSTIKSIKYSHLPSSIKNLMNYGIVLIAIGIRVRNIIAIQSPEIIQYRNKILESFCKRNIASQYQSKIYLNIPDKENVLHDKTLDLYKLYRDKINNDTYLISLIKQL